MYAARSGVELARLTLQEDDPAYDARDEAWALLDEHPGYLSEDDEGRFKGTIVDEASKIAINTLIGEGDEPDQARLKQLERLFDLLEIDPELIYAIVDWLDENHDEGPGGAEDAYYAELFPPYPCKDGPLSSLEELLLVKGMTAEVFYGTQEKKGLIHYLTIYSSEDGKININTASPEVLQSLSDQIDEDMAQAIVDYLREEPYKEGNLKDHIKFLVEINEDECDNLQNNLCAVKSSTFSVRVEGQVRGIKKEIYTVVKRQEKTVEPIFWRIE